MMQLDEWVSNDDLRRAVYARLFPSLALGRGSYWDSDGITQMPFGIKWILVPGGTYYMGLSQQEEAAALSLSATIRMTLDEMRPVHEEHVGTFLMTERPITSAVLYRMGTADGGSRQLPVFVNRERAEAVAASLSGRLPSEAEWEYACRAGSNSLFAWGDVLLPESELAAWVVNDYDRNLHPARNRLGLVGLFTGEWCSDVYRDSYSTASRPRLGQYVIRGGAAVFWPWQDDEWVWCASAMRMPSGDLIDDTCGFRVARSVECDTCEELE